MRTAARKDANHQEIVEALRQVGAKVKDLAGLPGALDLLVGFRGQLYWFEIKDGRKMPSQRKLTKEEQAVFDEFDGCPVYKVESVDQAYRILGIVDK